MEQQEIWITAQQYVDEGYEEKAKRNECRIIDEFPMDDFMVTEIRVFSDHMEVAYADAPNDFSGINPKTKLRVDFPPYEREQPITPPQPLSELAALRQQVATLTGELEAAKQAHYDSVAELIEELPHNQITQELVVKSLRAVGFSEVDIRGYFGGNIIP